MLKESWFYDILRCRDAAAFPMRRDCSTERKNLKSVCRKNSPPPSVCCTRYPPGQRFGAAATPLIQNTLENKGDFEKMKLGIVENYLFSYLHNSQ